MIGNEFERLRFNALRNKGGASTGGYLYGWGNNVNSQLGIHSDLLGDDPDGTNKYIYKPTLVGMVGELDDISIGTTHSLLLQNGKMYGWGTNEYRQLGTEDGDMRVFDTMVQLGNDDDWTHICAGYGNSFGIRNEELYVVGIRARDGLGGHRELTSYYNYFRNIPVDSETKGWRSIKYSYNPTNPPRSYSPDRSMGGIFGNYTYFWGGGGYNDAWGDAYGSSYTPKRGYYIKGTEMHFLNEMQIRDSNDKNDPNYKMNLIYVGKQTNITYTNYQSPKNFNTYYKEDSYKQISIGNNHTIILDEEGYIHSFGNRRYGEGIGNKAGKKEGYGKWRKVLAGRNYSIGIKEDGTLWSWGSNSNGSLGVEGINQTDEPVQIGSDNDWLNIFVTEFSVLATKASKIKE